MRLHREKYRFIKVFFLSISYAIPILGIAQESELGNWAAYFGNKNVGAKWNIHHEMQYRNYNGLGDLEQLLLRGGVGYTFEDGNSNALLGYAFILSENYVSGTEEKLTVAENRIFQQFITKQAIGKVSLSHRYRIEQRFIEDDFRLRLRYFLGIRMPVIRSGKLYLSLYNEIFLHTDQPVFDRDRLYGGFGYRLNDKLKVELGLMYQFFEKGYRDQINILCFYDF